MPAHRRQATAVMRMYRVCMVMRMIRRHYRSRDFRALLAELESGDDAIVSLDVFALEVVEETTTLRDHEHDAAA